MSYAHTKRMKPIANKMKKRSRFIWRKELLCIKHHKKPNRL